MIWLTDEHFQSIPLVVALLCSDGRITKHHDKLLRNPLTQIKLYLHGDENIAYLLILHLYNKTHKLLTTVLARTGQEGRNRKVPS